MTTELTTLLAVLAGTMVVVAGLVLWWINRTPHVRREEYGALPLFGVLDHTERSAVRAVAAQPAPPSRGRESAPVAARTARAQAAPDDQSFATPRAIREFTTARAPVAPAPAQAPPSNGSDVASPATPVVNAAGVPGTMVEAHAVRFSVPADGTLQFLPGRLEITSGLDAGREIRFVHLPGAHGSDVTFGRTDGELYRHVQLHDKTVSRQHATLQWREGHWLLQNQSATNPVALNGRVLDRSERPQLEDGDRIEMGEVLFTFRSR